MVTKHTHLLVHINNKRTKCYVHSNEKRNTDDLTVGAPNSIISISVQICESKMMEIDDHFITKIADIGNTEMKIPFDFL